MHFPCQGEQDSLRRQIARYANDELVLYSLYGQNHLFRKNSMSIRRIADAFGIKLHALDKSREKRRYVAKYTRFIESSCDENIT